jgi:hypothetical protein
VIAVVLFCVLCAALCVVTLRCLERGGHLAAQLVVCKAVLYLVVPAFINALALQGQYSVTLGQLLGVLLFFVAALAAAAIVRSIDERACGPASSAAAAAIEVPRSHVLILTFVCLALWLLNVYAWIEYDLFFRRIGTEQIAQVYAGLPGPVRVGLRLWDVLMGPGLILLVVFYWRDLRGIGRAVVVILCAGFVVYTIIASRLLMLDFFLLLLVARQTRFRQFIKYAPLLLIPAFATFFLRAGFELDTARGQVWSQWVERVDCFSVVGEIDERMWSASDPLLGGSWIDATFGRLRALVDPSFREAFVASAETGSKNAIAASFALRGKGPDYVSCIVSDVYGNLWLPGMFFIGFALVLLTALLERNLHVAHSLHDRLFLVATLACVLIFEHDLSDVVNLIVVAWAAALAFSWAGWSWQRATRPV